MMRGWFLATCLVCSPVFAADMIEVRYQDQEPGAAAYTTRILVTPRFMRVDGGRDEGDFFLLDRRRHTLVNVMRDSKLAMVFRRGALPQKPSSWHARLETHAARPGTRAYTLTVRDTVCSEGVAASKAAPDVAKAMAEMKDVLASMQYRVWKETLPSAQHDCDLANHVWETGTTLRVGLPLEERDFTGRTRVFESETRLPQRPGLFRVPRDMPRVDAPS